MQLLESWLYMYLKYYLKCLGYYNLPEFLIKYLNSPSLLRLKNIGYFCGMDYASKDIYNFREFISRYDHSVTVSLMVYKLTNDKRAALAGLFHDIATPCFSHVIDYMNGDYENQESTEEYTEYILKNDEYLVKCLKSDGFEISDVSDFKKYSVVDNDRPKACADRIDGVILTGIGWTKNIDMCDIDSIVNNMAIFINEYREYEIGFKSTNVAKKVVDVSKSIDIYCHSREDNYMMQLLARIAKISIEKGYISYNNLYSLDEKTLLLILKSKNDTDLMSLIIEFETKKKKDIPDFDMPKVKVRSLNPLVNGKRLL